MNNRSSSIPLTRRESEVARIAAAGYSSKYVAARLFLSSRTVETHLRHVYEKLGLTCRDELIEHYENGMQ